ncbi:MAG TPA: biotin/lipoyl-binding protein [Candidatus Paceibacterota bacterium]|jgi:multidrug efflux pump subunit AcrA (membrane-fusion protein)|nr:biotin/lipoyl-binding protein [Candidatus Paceibacterota bacterium]
MTAFIHKPKLIIPIVAVIAIVAGFFLYRSVGVAPIVSLPASQVSSGSATSGTVITNSSDNQFDLAFPQGGRVASVSVKVGDHVTKGQTLASLDSSSALGAVSQAKGALELAQAQYASQDVQYANAKKQQDVLVQNAYRTLLSSGLTATPTVQDDSHVPTISGTYTCEQQGSYTITPYPSGATSGFSFTYSGLEKGGGQVTYNTPQPLGSCGLFVTFVQGFSGATKWTVNIPNTQSSNYVQNKNAYDLAVSTRDQVLSQYEANLSAGSKANTAKAAVDSAEGVYQAALGAYQNDLIVAPVSGTVSFIDTDLKSGQSVAANKAVISITINQ